MSDPLDRRGPFPPNPNFTNDLIQASDQQAHVDPRDRRAPTDYSATGVLHGGNAQQASQDPWKHRSQGMQCGTRMWFVAKVAVGPHTSGGRVLGRCRRHAPTMSGYPAVFQNDWCGDHKLDEGKL